jgi:hypothetical protein
MKSSSRYLLSGALALCVAAMSTASIAFAQGKQDFTLHNKTGVEIHELYVAPHESDNWEEDVLGRDTLPDGETVEITFARKEKAKLWDIKIVDGEENSVEWESLNLLEISEVTLHKKGDKVWATVK